MAWFMKIFIAMASLLIIPGTVWGRGVPIHDTLYPQVFDLTEGKRLNLYASTTFKVRHTRFFNELSDSIRSLKKGSPDSLGFSAILSFRVTDSGAIDSVFINCADTSCSRIAHSLHERIHTWHFSSSPPMKLLIVQDIETGKRNPIGFFQRNRKKVIVGLIILGIFAAF